MKYCIICERNLTTIEQIEVRGLDYHHLPVGANDWINCYGIFTYSAPPELPEDWELWAVEPDADELEQMDRIAESLLLEFR